MIAPILPYAAGLVKAQGVKTLALADLHIGWEMALVQKGIHVPSQTRKLQQNLVDLLVLHRPDRLLILGDVKHTIATAEASEWRDVPDFFVEVRKHVKEVDVLRGNHDGNLEPLLPEGIGLLPAGGVVFGDVGFFHGHQWPSPALLGCKTLVMGHVHPIIAFRDLAGFRISRQVWIKADCDATQLTRVLLQKHGIKTSKSPVETLEAQFNVKPKAEQLFIMPSFNEFLGGRPLNETERSEDGRSERIVGPVLRSEAIDMPSAEAYLLDGTFIGTLRQLEISR
jgi:putative SbcD/Mre11-related phosphoesterase